MQRFPCPMQHCTYIVYIYIDEVHTPVLNLVPRSKYRYVEIYEKQNNTIFTYQKCRQRCHYKSPYWQGERTCKTIIPQNTDEKTRKEIWLSSKKTKFDKLVVQTIGLDAHKTGPKKLQLTITLTEKKWRIQIKVLETRIINLYQRAHF